MTISNEQILLNEINTRVKQYMEEHTQENDQSDEEYYHVFLYQHAGYIDGLYSVLNQDASDLNGWREYVRAAIDDNKNKNKSKKHKLLFHINQIMKIVLFLSISGGVAAVIISAVSLATHHIKLM